MAGTNKQELAYHYHELTKARGPVSNDPKEVIKRYDELASTYDEHAQCVGLSAADAAARRLPEVEPNKEALILDVGCGTGMLGELLYKDGYRNVYGVDPSEKSCDVARAKGCYETIIQGVARPNTPLGYTDGGYMVISTRKASLNETDNYRVKSTFEHFVANDVLEEISYQEFDDYFAFATENVTGIVLTYRKK